MISKEIDRKTSTTSRSIEAVRAGEWVPVEELRECLVAMLRSKGDISVNVEGAEYFDAPSFQLLVAAAQDRKTTDDAIRLLNASESLSQWIAHAGAVKFFA